MGIRILIRIVIRKEIDLQLLVLDRNSWKLKTVWKLLVLYGNTLHQITM